MVTAACGTAEPVASLMVMVIVPVSIWAKSIWANSAAARDSIAAKRGRAFAFILPLPRTVQIGEIIQQCEAGSTQRAYDYGNSITRNSTEVALPAGVSSMRITTLRPGRPSGYPEPCSRLSGRDPRLRASPVERFVD